MPLIKAVADRDAGLKTTGNYTVALAVQDWLAKGLKGRDEETITANRILAEQHVLPLIGACKLTELAADDVDEWLDGLTAKLATRSLQGVHAILKWSIRQARARDRVLRNVAELVTTPKGKPGRPSKSMTFEQATAMLEQAKASRLHAYVVVSLLTGIRTEEARALRWSHAVAWVSDEAGWRPVTDVGFDHDRFAIYVWRSVRANGDTKTREVPQDAGTPWPGPPTRSGNSAHGKRRRGWPQARCGKITASSSPAGSVRPWTHRTSAGPSRRSPRRLGSGRTGRPGNCVTRSCPS